MTRRLTCEEELRVGMILMDKDGNLRTVLAKTEKHWVLSHKNAKTRGFFWTGKDLIKTGDKIVFDPEE